MRHHRCTEERRLLATVCQKYAVSKKRGGFFGPKFFWREREEKRGKRRKRRKINTKEREKNKKQFVCAKFFLGPAETFITMEKKANTFCSFFLVAHTQTCSILPGGGTSGGG